MKENYNDRKVFCLSGADAKDFLQDLITNDIAKAEQGLSYAALLGPQGKFLFDFFLFTNICSFDQVFGLSATTYNYYNISFICIEF